MNVFEEITALARSVFGDEETKAALDQMSFSAAFAGAGDAAADAAWDEAGRALIGAVYGMLAVATIGNLSGPILAAYLDKKPWGGVLKLIGVMHQRAGYWDIDWGGLKSVLDNSSAISTKDGLAALFGVAGFEGAGEDGIDPNATHLVAVANAMVAAAPQTVNSLREGSLRVQGLAPPPVRSDPNGPWARFRQVTREWVSVTVPFAQSTNSSGHTHEMIDWPNWAADMQPAQALTLAFRSSTRAEGDDFEAWIHVGEPMQALVVPMGAGPDPWQMRMEPAISAGFGHDAGTGSGDAWRAAFATSPHTPANLDAPVRLTFSPHPRAQGDDIIFGSPQDTHFAIHDITGWLTICRVAPEFQAGLTIEGVRAVLSPRWFRSFGRPDDSFGGGVEFEFDFELAYRLGQGVSANGSGGLDVIYFWEKKLQGAGGWSLTIHSLRLALDLSLDGTRESVWNFRSKLMLHFSAKVGPLTAVVDGVGVWFGRWQQSLTGYTGILPPTGLGLRLDCEIATGGGFVDYRGGPTDRYAGVLQLKVGVGKASFDVIAFAVHETVAGETSVLMALGARWPAGLPVGMGVEVTGIGGIIGLNRRIDTDALARRLGSGAAGNVLYCDDPVVQAPQLFSDVAAVFPPAPGVFLVGPTIRLTWAEVLDVDLGFFVEFACDDRMYGTTGLTKVVVLGSARCSVDIPGTDLALVDIQLDCAGYYDHVEQLLAFDASLVRGTFLFVFTLTGDAVVRWHWGEHAYFVLSLGGFHPDYVPDRARLPELARVGVFQEFHVGLESCFRLECYLAFTSNSIQLGARIEARIWAGPCDAIGWFGFDAIIQFIPPAFSVTISAGLRIRLWGVTLCGVRLSGTLSAPPLTLAAKFCVEVLFFDLCVSGTLRFGEAGSVEGSASIVSLFDLVHLEVADQANLTASTVDTGQTSRRTSASGLAVSPSGGLRWGQRIVPLDTLVERICGAPLAEGASAVVVRCEHATGVIRDQFAPGGFTDLTQAEALNRAAFERLPAGIELGFGEARSQVQQRVLGVVEMRLPEEPSARPSRRTKIPGLVTEQAQDRNAATGSFARDASQRLALLDERWSVRGTARVDGLSQTDAYQRARIEGGVALPEAEPLVSLGEVG